MICIIYFCMEQSSTAVKKNNKKLKAAANLKKVSNSLFFTLCSLRGEIIFCRGLTSSGVPPALLSPRSSVRRRAMFLVVDKVGLSGEGEQKYGKMFNCSSRIKRRVERRNEQLNLLLRLRHTLSRTQKLVLFSKTSQYSQHSQASLIPISTYWEQSIFLLFELQKLFSV